MQATSGIPRDLTVLFIRLADMERMATTQEWWMLARVLPEARRLAELSSLLTAARRTGATTEPARLLPLCD